MHRVFVCLVVVVCALALPSSVSAAVSHSVTASATVDAPSRGSITVQVTPKVTFTAGECPTPTSSPPVVDGCKGHTFVEMRSAAQGCPARTSPFDLSPGALWSVPVGWAAPWSDVPFTQIFDPPVAGPAVICVTMVINNGLWTSGTVVGSADIPVTVVHVYPTDNKTCASFPNQRAAQEEYNRWLPRRPYKLDGDLDGRACEALPCPCYFGSDYPAPAPPAPVQVPAPKPPTTNTTPSGQSTQPPAKVPSPKVTRQTGRVTKVIDGDTLKVRLSSGRSRSVRLIGVDAPETRPGRGECGARQAKNVLRSLVLNKRGRGRTVTLTSDPTQAATDRYGRLLAYVGTTVDVNRSVIASGWAGVYIDDDTPFTRTPRYKTAANDAKARRIGVWAKCGGDFHRRR